MSSNIHLLYFPSNLYPKYDCWYNMRCPSPTGNCRLLWLQPSLGTAYLQLSWWDFTGTTGFSSYTIENCLTGGKVGWGGGGQGGSRSNSGFLHFKPYFEWMLHISLIAEQNIVSLSQASNKRLLLIFILVIHFSSLRPPSFPPPCSFVIVEFPLKHISLFTMYVTRALLFGIFHTSFTSSLQLQSISAKT